MKTGELLATTDKNMDSILIVSMLNVQEIEAYRVLLQKHRSLLSIYKKEIIQFTVARMFDDAVKNHQSFLALKKEFPKVNFEAFLIHENGSITRYGG